MPKILIVNCAESGIKEFTQPLQRIVSETGSVVVCIEYSDCLITPMEEFDGVLLSGSPQGDDIVEHHLPYFKWIKNFNKPVFGICAGHHITGYLYGAKIRRSEEPESGDFEIKLCKEDALFTGLPKVFTGKQMHNDSITLPNNFDLLATSDTCFNQLMKHKQKTLYTCQFHPEYYNHQLIRNFIALCP